MAPLIRAVLANLLGEADAERVEIIANDVNFDSKGRWHIQYRHPERYATFGERAVGAPSIYTQD